MTAQYGTDDVKLSITDLPNETLGIIFDHCGSDMATVRNFAQSDSAIQTALHKLQWKCQRCWDVLFLNDKLETKPHAQPFVCEVCHGKFCGEKVDYDRRYCRPQKCDGCGKVECHRCLQNHMENSDGYGTESYCQECQEEFDFGMGGC